MKYLKSASTFTFLVLVVVLAVPLMFPLSAQATEQPSVNQDALIDVAPPDAPVLLAASPADSCGQNPIWDGSFHKYEITKVENFGGATRITYAEWWWHIVTWNFSGTVECWL